MIRLLPRDLAFTVLLLSIFSSVIFAQSSLQIDAGQPGEKVSPVRYGLMTEEINHSYDGGLYAELVRNRALLDDKQKPAHWSVFSADNAAGAIAVDHDQPLNGEVPASLRLDVASASAASPVGIANEGYWGIPVKPRTKYRASFFAKAKEGSTGPVTVSIVGSADATVFATGVVANISTEWKQYDLTLTTGDVQPTNAARLVLSVERAGTVWFSLVSLFPPTLNDRVNGLRPDIMQMMIDLKPAFLRFPGGNYVEGNTIADRFDWKRTIGPISQRPGHNAPWGYRSTDGLGLLEFLTWCQDMKAEPILAVYAGYSLGGQHIDAGPELQPFVQDALDEIEYVTGDASTTWGARRAADGHPEPFALRYVEIGNEDNFDKSNSYDGRFTQFVNAIKAKYPNLKCISTIVNSDPERMRVHSVKPDVLDEHYYRSAATFLKDSPTMFTKYSRPAEIFVGEWAAYEDVEPWKAPSKTLPPTPSMKAALGDASFMTAMERNSDVVTMQCYAPMFVNVNPGARQWRPNLIGYDGLRVFGSPSYYAIKMFSTSRGDEVLKATLTGETPIHYSVTRDGASGAIYLKLVNAQAEAKSLRIEVQNGRPLASSAKVLTLSGELTDTNSIDEPTKVAPVETTINGISNSFEFTVAANSITVVNLTPR